MPILGKKKKKKDKYPDQYILFFFFFFLFFFFGTAMYHVQGIDTIAPWEKVL